MDLLFQWCTDVSITHTFCHTWRWSSPQQCYLIYTVSIPYFPPELCPKLWTWKISPRQGNLIVSKTRQWSSLLTTRTNVKSSWLFTTCPLAVMPLLRFVVQLVSCSLVVQQLTRYSTDTAHCIIKASCVFLSCEWCSQISRRELIMSFVADFADSSDECISRWGCCLSCITHCDSQHRYLLT